jgi:glycosyltransferase involved in cell wall biosynthesis
MTWHVLDIGSVWMKEFASALGEFVPVMGWLPAISWTGFAQRGESEKHLSDPPLTYRVFPLQRGYHRFPVSFLSNWSAAQTRRMQRCSGDAKNSPLICTTPFYAPIAEKWPGPVIYYQTDLTFGYAGINPGQVRALDWRLCRIASAVCLNSRRVAEYMVSEAQCDPAKIDIVPNATRESNLLLRAPEGPAEVPDDLRDLQRPVIGVIGNLAANLNWRLLLNAVERTPQYSWAFIGPTHMEVPEIEQREAREKLMKMGGRVRFTGGKAYGLLQDYARALDVAVLPYRRKEPTFSGSSTRFYEHLAACRPMIATRGFEELLHKEPLLRLIDTPEQLAAELDDLARHGFSDGWEEARWQASRQGTWQVRAAMVITALKRRWRGGLEMPERLPEFDPNTAYPEPVPPHQLPKFTMVAAD